MSSLSPKVLLDRSYGTIYGNCIGDAIGLLTEFMNKTKAISVSFFSFLLFLSGYLNLCVHNAPINVMPAGGGGGGGEAGQRVGILLF